jgi:hypothetical protein
MVRSAGAIVAGTVVAGVAVAGVVDDVVVSAVVVVGAGGVVAGAAAVVVTAEVPLQERIATVESAIRERLTGVSLCRLPNQSHRLGDPAVPGRAMPREDPRGPQVLESRHGPKSLLGVEREWGRLWPYRPGEHVPCGHRIANEKRID